MDLYGLAGAGRELFLQFLQQVFALFATWFFGNRDFCGKNSHRLLGQQGERPGNVMDKRQAAFTEQIAQKGTDQ